MIRKYYIDIFRLKKVLYATDAEFEAAEQVIKDLAYWTGVYNTELERQAKGEESCMLLGHDFKNFLYNKLPYLLSIYSLGAEENPHSYDVQLRNGGINIARINVIEDGI
jgi:hypothetical protein